MSNEIRGSEKLHGACSSLADLTREEIEQISGGLSLSFSYQKIFPRGIPWPEWYDAGRLQGQLVDPQQLDVSNGF